MGFAYNERMELTRIQTYLEMRDRSYQIIERTLFHVAQTVFSQSLTAKKLNTLYLIYAATRDAHPSITELAEKSSMPINTYSKRIQALIQDGYLKTYQDTVDHRIHHVSLTEEGRRQIDAYIALIDQLLGRLKEAFGISGLLRYVQALIHTANALNDDPPLSKWAFSVKTYQRLAAEAINRIYEGISRMEHPVLEEYFEDFTLKEARVLLEIYLQDALGKITLKGIEAQLKIPKPTLSRIVNKFSPAYIHKKKDKHDHRVVYLSIRPGQTAGFERWVESRIQAFETVQGLHKPKRFEQLLTSFKILETLLLEQLDGVEEA